MERLNQPATEGTDRPVFGIVDPSLRDFVGHHFAYDDAVARAAATAGFRCVTLAHRDVSEAIAGGGEVVRCFRRDIWTGVKVTGPVPRQLRAAAGMWLANRAFLADLRNGLRGLAMPPDSILLAHMIFRDQLPALARFVLDQPAGGGLEIILLLRYQCEFYDNPLCERAFRKLERAAASGRRVRLATDSARLSRELGRLTRLPIEVMPIPHTSDASASVPPRRPGAPLRFVSLGGARDEKGYVEILDAIRILRARGELDGTEFVLQSNDAAPDVQAAIDAFDPDCPETVTLLGQPLSPQEYASQLLAADAVLVPYWREIYRARTSGVCLEAIAAGKIVIATRDTWMSDELERGGAGVLVADHDPASIADAVRTVRRDHDRLARQAVSGRDACLTRHCPEALIRQAVEGPPAEAMPVREVRRVAVLYPWGDFLDCRSGASVRCNMLVKKISPLVEEIRVLQDGGPGRGFSPRRALVSLKVRTRRILGRLGMMPALPPAAKNTVKRIDPTPVAPAGNLPAGNVRVEGVPLRTRQKLARRLFRLPFQILMRRHAGQELMPWFFLERRLDPLFAAKVREMVAWADVVLLEYPFWASIVAPVCKTWRKTLIVTNHDVLSHQVTGSRWLRELTARLENRGLASGDHAVCVSESDRAWFANAGIDATVIANPVDNERFATSEPGDPREMLRERHGIVLPPGPICLFVGSLYLPNVQAAEQIKVMAARMPASDRPVAFAIAGGCAEPASGPNWTALGRIEDGVLTLLYQAAALVLIPLGAGTGSSMKTMEALAAGKPVLGTSMAFRGLRVNPGEDCVLRDDLAFWPSDIAALLAAPARMAALGGAARRAAQGYDYRVVFDAYLPLMGLALTSPRVRAGLCAGSGR